MNIYLNEVFKFILNNITLKEGKYAPVLDAHDPHETYLSMIH